MTTATLPREVISWIQYITGADGVEAQRRPGGGRREAWLVDVHRSDGVSEPLFLRYDRSDPADSGDPFTLDRESRFYAALQDSEVPVPRLVGSHPELQAVLCERVSGETWFSRLTDEDQRLTIAREFMTKLAALHRLDAAKVDIDEPRNTVRACVEADIARWEGLYRFGDPPKDPTVEFGLAWLKANIPDTDVAPVIVQGDTGPGNFLYQDGRITAVLDWELAHFGDPMDDLGWLALRAVQEPFTDFADRLADYERASGIAVDLDRLRYYRLFAELKVVILGFRRSVSFDPLAEQYGLTDDVSVQPDAEPTEQQWLYDVMLAQLRDIIVPGTSDPFAALRGKGLARIVKYLREVDRSGRAAEQLELDWLQALLGKRPATVATGRRALADTITADSLGHKQLVEYLRDRAYLQLALMRPAMGVLAERRFDPLPDEAR